MDERRLHPRKRILKGAKAAFGDFRFTYDCTMRNLSDDGAQVRCTHAAEIPDDFFLYDPGGQSLQRVEIVWRAERDLGIRFAGAPVNVHASGDHRHARFRFL
jgi:hypothetical protein